MLLFYYILYILQISFAHTLNCIIAFNLILESFLSHFRGKIILYAFSSYNIDARVNLFYSLYAYLFFFLSYGSTAEHTHCIDFNVHCKENKIPYTRNKIFLPRNRLFKIKIKNYAC